VAGRARTTVAAAHPPASTIVVFQAHVHADAGRRKRKSGRTVGVSEKSDKSATRTAFACSSADGPGGVPSDWTAQANGAMHGMLQARD
jgi:hypothetical protein